MKRIAKITGTINFESIRTIWDYGDYDLGSEEWAELMSKQIRFGLIELMLRKDDPLYFDFDRLNLGEVKVEWQS